eukprot:10128984-Ditylum_brightwellii.AAC.1
MAQWLRPEIQNAVRECSKLASFPTKTSQKVMKRAMKHCALTPKCGIKLAPKGVWDGRRGYLFSIK